MVQIATHGKKTTYKYYHAETCYPRHLKQQAFREKERQELDVLNDVIAKIFILKTVPNSAFPLLQDLRNGNKFFGKRNYKYKQGYSYLLIAKTFEYVSESIEKANRDKSFRGFDQAFRYALAIVCDKLMIVENMERNKEQQEKKMDVHLEKTGPVDEQFQTSYKPKKKSANDISDFLDD